MKTLAALVLLVVPQLVAAHGPAEHAQAATRIMVEPERLVLPNLPVTDRFGNRTGFRDALPQGRTVILSFTYTACETLCDISNAVLTVVDADLGSGSERAATIVTVAIDPLRDTPKAMEAEAEKLGAGPDWLWLTGGAQATKPLLEALRFPVGAVEDHDPMFLVGRPCRGQFTRVVGLVDPEALVELAQAQPACDG